MIKDLIERIQNKKALIGVVGLGYVGLPLVREFTGAGMKVLGLCGSSPARG
jgi:UDP-N-acetyl-D-glucosamine dehydrogenase